MERHTRRLIEDTPELHKITGATLIAIGGALEGLAFFNSEMNKLLLHKTLLGIVGLLGIASGLLLLKKSGVLKKSSK